MSNVEDIKAREEALRAQLPELLSNMSLDYRVDQSPGAQATAVKPPKEQLKAGETQLVLSSSHRASTQDHRDELGQLTQLLRSHGIESHVHVGTTGSRAAQTPQAEVKTTAVALVVDLSSPDFVKNLDAAVSGYSTRWQEAVAQKRDQQVFGRVKE